ncbi:MAG TPA: DUF6345 domain-containing protein [Solirubrobacteraceae bacterium]|nr:DUF6345 domain-containing protein [Solirubrobacteraceae bacterium]
MHWSDNVHFCYFADHGLNENNTFFIGFSFQHEFCVGTSAEWRLGAGELKWLVLDTCDAVLNTDPSHIAATWGGPMQGCHMVFGFIGENTDEWFTRDRGKDFGNEVGAGTVLAESWLNHAYSWWLGDNPIAIAAGENEADAVNRRETESIGGRDFPVLTTAFLAWKWRS